MARGSLLVCSVVALACLVASAAAGRNGHGNADSMMFSDTLGSAPAKAAPAQGAAETSLQSQQASAGAQAQQQQQQVVEQKQDNKQFDLFEAIGLSSPVKKEQHYEEPYYKKDEYKPEYKDEYKPEYKDEYKPEYKEEYHEDKYYKQDGGEDEHYAEKKYGYEEEHHEDSYGPKQTSICLMESKRVYTQSERYFWDSEFRCCTDKDSPDSCIKGGDYYGSDSSGEGFMEDVWDLTTATARCHFEFLIDEECDPSVTDSEICTPSVLNCTISAAAKDCGCNYEGGMALVAEGTFNEYDVYSCKANYDTPVDTRKAAKIQAAPGTRENPLANNGLTNTTGHIFKGAIKYIQTREGFKEVKGEVQYVIDLWDGIERRIAERHPVPPKKVSKGAAPQPAKPRKQLQPIKKAAPVTPPAPKKAAQPKPAPKKPVPSTHTPSVVKKPAPVNAPKVDKAPVVAKQPAVTPNKPAAATKPAPAAAADPKKPATATKPKAEIASADYARRGGPYDFDPSHYYAPIVTGGQLTINFVEGGYY